MILRGRRSPFSKAFNAFENLDLHLDGEDCACFVMNVMGITGKNASSKFYPNALKCLIRF